jgi:2-hydroxy-3-keto-5-methylthiopentenyl-1-phosphate phosphatase
MPNIAIVWDFDGTLTPQDSTTTVVECLQGSATGGEFWKRVHYLRGDKGLLEWEHILASDAPIWMYSLSRLAFEKQVPLNTEFFKEVVLPYIQLFDGVEKFLRFIKDLEKTKEFKEVNLSIHHFIVSAGLQDLISLVFAPELITRVFGCRYTVIANEGKEAMPESIPVFCMDETVKTRSLFEISKGSFNDENKPVNKYLESKELFAPFTNMIYIGDGDTDVPALSLTRSKGGTGIALYNPTYSLEKRQERLKKMQANKRADLVTAADFSLDGELLQYLKARCIQISQRYQAEACV